MVGLCWLLVGGIFRLGWIADLLSIPVTVGFLAGISVHILISQLPAILGLPTPSGPMLQRLATLAGQFSADQSCLRWASARRAGDHHRFRTDRRADSRRADRLIAGGRRRHIPGTGKPRRRVLGDIPGRCRRSHPRHLRSADGCNWCRWR
jgi:hypothetical protein